MEDMANCPQTETLSVLDHGNSVWSYTQRILNKETEGIKLPDWFLDNYDEILNSLHDVELIKEYNIFHDCGKPYCIEYDAEGKKHFPNHAAVSRQTYFNLSISNLVVTNLIGWDMVLHTSTADEIKEIGLSKKDAFTLLVTAFGEIHSNASMFGGQDSISFKSKWKKLDQRGKQLMRGEF